LAEQLKDAESQIKLLGEKDLTSKDKMEELQAQTQNAIKDMENKCKEEMESKERIQTSLKQDIKNLVLEK